MHPTTPMPTPPSLRHAAVAAMRRHGFDSEFPVSVLHEVGALCDPSTAPPRGTEDLRALPWSSVDNRESRDLDQIEVAERLPDGSIRIRIGVADVDTPVLLGSAADAYAAKNTTSVYTGVAVFPMLPERLSTDLTSLNEGEDRLAVVVQFDVATDGALANASVQHALVRNHAKLTYDSVGMWLEGTGPPPRAIAEWPALRDQLLLQDEAAQRQRRSRMLGGALNFESVEAAPVVVNGTVVDLAVAPRHRGRDLIEDFMVAANRSVAAFLLERNLPSLRRVVRAPKRWDRIVALAAETGDVLPDTPDGVALSAFLARRREADPRHFADLSLAVVKLLGPGVYVLERRLGSRRDAGHFGLAVADYVHSTAPNRRFADLVTQRMLLAATRGDAPPYSDAQLVAIAARCTERGDAARKVERTMRKVIGASLLADRVGERFAAVVTAATPKGTYARVLSPPVEGRIVRGGDELDVGDTVRLTLLVADSVRGYIDFAHESTEASRKQARRRRKTAAADLLRGRIGEMFDVQVTGVSERGTYVRALDGSAEGRVVRGYKGLAPGMTVTVALVDTDSVHGFIDFEFTSGLEAAKQERWARKRSAAVALQHRVGEIFRAVVTGGGESGKATWIATVAEKIEGRLVRGRGSLVVGDAVVVMLLAADPVRGFIDFAHAESARSGDA